MDDPTRARSWKRQTRPRVGLKAVEPVLYSTVCPKPTQVLAVTFLVDRVIRGHWQICRREDFLKFFGFGHGLLLGSLAETLQKALALETVDNRAINKFLWVVPRGLGILLGEIF